MASRFDEAPITPETVDDALFGRTQKDGLIISKPIDIMKIWADVKQPRRIIPAEIRGEWQGNPNGVAQLLADWHDEVEVNLDRKIDINHLLMSHGDGVFDDDGMPAIAADYFALTDLAADIVVNGLTNSITAIGIPGGAYSIETGERRWLAYHLLRDCDDKFHKISVQVVERHSLYRQASENGLRSPLNAVARARQLALLIIDLYPNSDDLDEYETLIAPGECDRMYYAQIANGKLWPIKDGYGKQIARAMGLTSRIMISRYRKLLTLPDEQWIMADDDNWSESKIRGWLDACDLEAKEAALEKERIAPGSPVLTPEGKGILTVSGVTGYRVRLDGKGYDEFFKFEEVELLDAKYPQGKNERIEREIANLLQIAENEGLPVDAADELLPIGNRFNVGDQVMTPDGPSVIEHAEAQQPDDNGDWVNGCWVRFDNGDGVFFQHEQVSAIAENDDLGFIESVTDEVYVPETHENATPMISLKNPKLALLVKALESYYDENDLVPDTEIGWVLEGIQDTAGQIVHEISESAGNCDNYHADMRRSKMIMRSYLELITQHIEQLIDSMIAFAADVHVETWEKEDNDDIDF